MMPVKTANRVLARVGQVHRVFGGFITGKLIDSMIIGVLCFIGLRFLKMPYEVLIAVIVGVTNIIPFFGPFIGAIPSAILIAVINPVKAVYFIIFILFLQQFDGNILGPKILGDSTGLSSFWVMFAILLFGGVFGFVGMAIGVPVFAVLYSIATERLNNMLKRRGLSTDTTDYRGACRIDPDTRDFVAVRQEERSPVTKKERKHFTHLCHTPAGFLLFLWLYGADFEQLFPRSQTRADLTMCVFNAILSLFSIVCEN